MEFVFGETAVTDEALKKVGCSRFGFLHNGAVYIVVGRGMLRVDGQVSIVADVRGMTGISINSITGRTDMLKLRNKQPPTQRNPP